MHALSSIRDASRRRLLRLSIAASLLLLSALVLTGCSDGDDEEQQDRVSAENQQAYCRNVLEVTASLREVREQLPAAIQQSNTAVFQVSLQETRNDMEALAGNAASVPGASDVVTSLYNDLQGYQDLLMSGNPVAALPQIQQQGDAITRELAQLAMLGDCPAQ